MNYIVSYYFAGVSIYKLNMTQAGSRNQTGAFLAMVSYEI